MTWSSDSRFLAIACEDDCISVFDFFSRAVLARGIGHSAFVHAVTFDTFKCTDDNLRLISAGEDGMMMLWDLERPAIIDPPYVDTHLQVLGSTPVFQPTSEVRGHVEPIVDIQCFEQAIVTLCNMHIVRFWKRPTTATTTSNK